MANSFPSSGLAYADAFSVGTADATASSLYVRSDCTQAVRIEHTFSQTNLHHNTLWLKAMNSGAKAAASIGFTVCNNGGDHHRANIEATANSGQIGGNLALYTRNNSGADTLGLYINHTGDVGINTTSPSQKFHVAGTSLFTDTMNFELGKISWNSTRFVITSCGTANIAFATDNFTDRMTIQCGTGYVGIGTASPNSKFHVACGQIRVEGQPSDDITGCSGYYLANAINNEAFQWQMSCNFNLSLWTYSAANGLNWGLRGPVITQTGRVGISTTSPSTPLQIRSNTIDSGGAGLSVFGFDGAVEFTTTRAESPANAAIYLYNRPTSGTNGTGTGISFRASSTNTADRPQGGIYSSWTDSTDATRTAKFYFDLVNSGTYATRMTLLGNGNLGIGTTVACTRLSVRCSTGGAKIDLLSLTTTDGAGSQPTLRFDTIEANCNVLGRISVCDVAPYAGTMIFETSAAKAAGSTTTTEVMRLVGTTGNVGIGTTSPTYGKLQVDGTGNNVIGFFGASTMTANQSNYLQIGKDQAVGNNAGEISFKYVGDNNASNMVSLGFYGNGQLLNIFPNGNVGIGTTSPNACTRVQINVAGSSCYGLMINKTTADEATIRFKSTHGCGSDYRIGASIYVDSAFEIAQQENSCSRFVIRCTGNIGIGTYTPSYLLHVNGTFYAAGSSIKYKEGICNYNTDSCLFMCLKPVTYQYKDEFKHLGKDLKSETQIGLIAEHVAEVMPELAILVNEEDNKVVRNVDYEKLSIVLLAEVQKLRKEVDALKS